jgi:hypothetical protein
MSETPAPTPATTTTVAPVATPTPFLTYLRTEVGNHIKLLLIVAGVVGSVLLYNYVKDLKAKEAAAVATAATLAQTYTQSGTSAIAANTTSPTATVASDADSVFGKALIATMQSQSAQIQSLTTALGSIGSSQAKATVPQTVFSPTQKATTTTALTDFPIIEQRASGPPLTQVNLSYDPTQSNPQKAFSGTTWTHYQENFSANIGQWEKQKTGAYATTVSLSRTVLRPDPTKPGSMLNLGTEQIPITGANTIYTPAGLAALVKVPDPRFTFGLGLATTNGGYSLAGYADYRATDRYGLFVGSANNSLFGGVSVRLGGKE